MAGRGDKGGADDGVIHDVIRLSILYKRWGQEPVMAVVELPRELALSFVASCTMDYIRSTSDWASCQRCVFCEWDASHGNAMRPCSACLLATAVDGIRDVDACMRIISPSVLSFFRARRSVLRELDGLEPLMTDEDAESHIDHLRRLFESAIASGRGVL